MFNLAHIHIVLNHIPAFGSLGCLLLLAAAIYTKNDALKKFTFLALVIVAMAVLPTYLTGAEAQRTVRTRPAVSRPMIQVHQNAAMVTIVLMTISGTFAWFGLWEFRRFAKATSFTTMGTLLTTAISVGGILLTASLGGKISHPEVRDGLDAAVTEAEGWREPIELWVSDKAWTWPAAETIHFIGMALLFGVSLLLLMRMLGAMKSIPFSGIHRLLPLGVLGFVANVLTGMLFFVASPGLYLGKSSFHIKMACIIIAAVPIMYFTMVDDAWETGSNKNASAMSKFLALATFGLVIAVVIYGRFLPFLS
jgi:hypothetical protein